MIKVDAITHAYLLNRYLAHIKTVFYSQGKKNVPIKEEIGYKIQWQNIKSDLKALFRSPFKMAPAIAYSLLAFWFIFQGKHLDAFLTAFPVGAIAYDTATPSDDVGEVPSITYTPTIGSGSDRYLTWDAQGFGGVLSSTFGGVSATVVINKSDDQKVWGYTAPATGTGNNIVISVASGNSILTSVSISFSGVDQTTPTGATSSADSTSASLTTTTANAMRVDFGVCINDNAANASATFEGNAPDTSWNGAQNQFRTFTAVAHTAQAVAGSATKSWSFTNGGFYQCTFAVEVIAATGGGGGSQIKKVAGTTQATTKKVSGVAIASIKKLSGVANT